MFYPNLISDGFWFFTFDIFFIFLFDIRLLNIDCFFIFALLYFNMVAIQFFLKINKKNHLK